MTSRKISTGAASKLTNYERWHLGKLTQQEIEALPGAVDLIDLCRARGIGRDAAYAELKRNLHADEHGRLRMSVLFGIPVEKLGTRWVGSKDDLMATMRRGARSGAVA